MTKWETILVETKNRVGWITLNRPEVLNALSSQVMREVTAATTDFDRDPDIGAIVITGSERAFAAGADINELQGRETVDALLSDPFRGWKQFADVRTPTIAAVSGYALGGGCEVAMMCDIIIASDTATFGQPEINLALIPGMGGTQRLVRAVGYSKAADMILSGRSMKADEAERAGLVSRVVPVDELLTVVRELAETIASKSILALLAAKQALDAAQETHLAEGLRAERQAILPLYSTMDRKEGTAAFLEKRQPLFSGQ